MQIKINDVLRAYIEPLTESEYQALERSILTEGCRDALVLWQDVLVDGHNRYQICQEHGIPFKVTENTSFRNFEDVKLWMIDNNLGRRSISDYQRGVLALRKKEIMSARALELAAEAAAEDAKIAPPEGDEAPSKKPAAMPLASREDIARAARLSTATIGQIEKIQKTATPELVEAVRTGTISINAAATVASLSEEQQLAAVAGGKKELQKAAKEVRDLRAAARPAKEPKEAKASPADYSDMPRDVQELRAENAALREKNAALLEEITVLQRRLSELANA